MSNFTSFLLPNNDNNIINQKNPILTVQTLDFNDSQPSTAVCNTIKPIESDDKIRIYLRLRPPIENDKNLCYTLSNPSEVLVTPPADSVSFRNFLHGQGKTSQRFTFSKIFPALTNQSAIFEDTTKPLIDDFVRGCDRLLFTYGTTSSGKTFTMTGSRGEQVGIVPRALIGLFKAAERSKCLLNDPKLMPVDFSEVCELKREDVQRILREKALLMKLSERDSSEVLQSIMMSTSECDEETAVMEDEEGECDKVTYSVTYWVSYTEIYNESVYDLLEPSQCQASTANSTKRPLLDIRTARNGGSYAKGLSCYPVFSAEEAYRLLLVGHRCQRTGATRLNSNSSRSHSLFTVRAVRQSPSSRYLTTVSNLTFCDLAGSERTEKAHTTGQSRREACNINSSLLALGRCIDVLRRNHCNPGNLTVVPFRDSKLTRLFQTYIASGKAAMIVCVNQDSRLFDETVQVLKFSALARKVIVLQPAPHQQSQQQQQIRKVRRSHFSRLGLNTPTHTKTKLSWVTDIGIVEEEEEVEEEEDEQDDNDEYTKEELFEAIEMLKGKLLETRKEKIVNEARLIDRLNDEWSRKMLQMENDHSDRLQEMREGMNDKMRKRVKVERSNAYAQMKKRRLQEEEEDNNSGGGSSEEKENVDMNSYRKMEREMEELRKKCKEAEEEAADSRETTDVLSQEIEKLKMFSMQQSFQLQMVEAQLSQRTKDTRDDSVQTEAEVADKDCIDADINIATSECSVSSVKQNRFSSFSCNPRLKTNSNSDSSTSTVKIKTAKTVTITKDLKKDIFKIEEEEVRDSDGDASFLLLEEKVRLSELEKAKELANNRRVTRSQSDNVNKNGNRKTRKG